MESRGERREGRSSRQLCSDMGNHVDFESTPIKVPSFLTYVILRHHVVGVTKRGGGVGDEI